MDFLLHEHIQKAYGIEDFNTVKWSDITERNFPAFFITGQQKFSRLMNLMIGWAVFGEKFQYKFCFRFRRQICFCSRSEFMQASCHWIPIFASCFRNQFHYEAKLCILCIVSGIRDKDAPFVLLLFFHFLWSFRQNLNMFKDLSLESRNIQTQNCAPIQCTIWPRNVVFSWNVWTSIR